MKMQSIFTILAALVLITCMTTPCFATLVPKNVHYTADFTSESHPTDSNNIRAVGTEVNFIRNGSWISFSNFNFGTGATHAYVEAGDNTVAGRSIEVRVGSQTGTVLGSVVVPITGTGNNFQVLEIPLSQTLTGNQNLFFTFVGGSGTLFETRGFWFPSVSPNQKQVGSVITATGFDSESHPDVTPIESNAGRVESIQHDSWIAFTGFNFGVGANRIEMETASLGRGGRVEVRLDSQDGTRVGIVDIGHSGSWTHHRIFSANLNQNVTGTRDLYLRFLDYDSVVGTNELFRLRRFSLSQETLVAAPTQEGRLSVYPHVPPTDETTVLNQSPYYRLSVQKKSVLNNTNPQFATNWLSPFAWFTQCVDYPSNQQTHSAYYDDYIGSWSHTYSNIELDRNTPIVVKITRLNESGAPSGPITSATAHPAHRVLSCDVINGEVYVTMSEPALVSIDIDGQMATRDTPRNIPNVWNSSVFPHRNKLLGVHAVSIFANPFIDDKPSPNGPGVRTVTPGQLPDLSGNWSTLYFLPGIHKLSVNPDGSERGWQVSDLLPLQSGKSYYIPGDAIVYGNMNDAQNGAEDLGIRVYGHGTLSGEKIPHFYDFPPGTTPPNQIPPVGSPDRGGYMTDDGAFLPPELNARLEMISLSGAENCHYEGITVANPPEHGIQMIGGKQRQNSVRWMKNISWRVNNDGTSIDGNTVLEDCFLRHQDDALYMSGQAVRRVVFWSDVNGTPFRSSFIHRERESSWPEYFPAEEVVEDCDVIFTRATFSFDHSPDSGVIGAQIDSSSDNKQYVDGTRNTAQHLVIRNIRITDPRPQRYLFGFSVNDLGTTDFKGWAGIRMENITMTHPNTWTVRNPPSPRPNRLLALTAGPARLWSFANVTIAGETMTQQMLDNPSLFQTTNVSEMLFKNTTYTLTRQPSTSGSITTGTISAAPHGSQFASNTAVQVLAVPAAGYVFSSWNGALSGSTANPAMIVMDADKTVSANFVPAGTAPVSKNILLIVPNAAALNPSDTAIRDRLQVLGHNVIVITAASSVTADANGKDLVIVSSTVSSGSVGTKFRDVTVPVMNWETALQDEFLFTTGAGQGTAEGQTTLNLVNAGHALAAGLPDGARPVMSGSSTSGFSRGQPGGNPIIIARINATAPADFPCIYAFEIGSAMETGVAAPARRVHLFLQNDTYVNLNNDGKNLFDAAVSWALATPMFTLSTTAANGSVTLSPAGGSYAFGTSVDVSVAANSGYRFDGWSGDLSGLLTTQTLVMNGNKTVTANFIRTYTLTTNAGIGGSISPASGGNYDENSLINVAAIPEPGFRFAGWSGALSGNTASTTLTMDGDKTITANFIRQFTLTTSAGIGGSVSPASGAVYDDGDNALLVATPDAGYRFTGWSGASTSANPELTLTMNSDKTVTANFIREYSLTIITGTGGSVSPASGAVYDDGDNALLVATPNAGYRFTAWSGASTSTNPSISLLMDADKTVTATFIRQYTLTTIAGTGGSVSPVTGNLYDDGFAVSVVATANSGYRFIGWSGASNATTPSISLPMDADKTINANFEASENSWIGANTPNWNDITSWTPSSIPTAGNLLIFSGSPANQPTNNDLSGLTTGAINFTNDSSAGKTDGFTLAGNGIILGGNIMTSAPTVAGNITDVIALNMELSANRTFNINRNASFGNHNLTVSGVISGTGSLTKNGGSTLRLENTNNSFSGAMNVHGFNETFATSIAASGLNSSIGSGNTIGMTGGSLVISGTSSGTIDRAFALNISTGQTARIDNNNANSAHAFHFNGTTTNTQGATGVSTFALGGSNVGENIFSPQLTNGTGTNVTAFTKAAGGTWTLAGINTYTGINIIENGTLNVSKIADSGESNLGYGASLRIGQGSQTGILNYTGMGNTTARQLTLGNIGSGGNINGGAVLNQNGANGGTGLKFTNPNFNTTAPDIATTRNITLGGTNTDANEISGVVINGNTNLVTSLTKNGTGRWILSSENLYAGATSATGGVLQLNHASAVPVASALTINGGIIGLGAGDFTRAIASPPAPGQVALTSSNGGFAAYGDHRAVNLGGSSAMLTWGGGGFFSSGQNTMVLGHATATHTLDFQNPINLNATSRTIHVNDGTASVDAILSGAISNSSGIAGLTKTGTGTLVLSGINGYTGNTQVSFGTLGLVGGSHASPIIVATGASLSFTLGSPSTSTASLDLTNGKVKISGAPSAASHLLMTASNIIGIPTLDVPVPGYELEKANGNTELRLTLIAPIDPYLTWAGPGVNFGDDANHDGVENGLAWLLGAASPTSSVTLPTVTRDSTGLVLSFSMRNAAGRGTAGLFVQHSSDLGLADAWTDSVMVPDTAGTSTPVNGVSFSVVLGDPLNTVVATISEAESTGEKLFGRLKGVK